MFLKYSQKLVDCFSRVYKMSKKKNKIVIMKNYYVSRLKISENKHRGLDRKEILAEMQNRLHVGECCSREGSMAIYRFLKTSFFNKGYLNDNMIRTSSRLEGISHCLFQMRFGLQSYFIRHTV